jgi:Putative adhesin
MKSIVLLSLLAASASLACASVTEPFKQTYPLAADGVIQLENVNGDIEIVAWDKPEVSLDAEKKAKDDDELKRISIVIDASPARLSIKTKYEKKKSFLGNNSGGTVRYKLMVPAGVQLRKIESVNSDIKISGVRGSVDLETVNGRIEADGLAADAKLDSVNGNLDATFVSLAGVQAVKLDSVNGRVKVTLPKGASAKIKTSSVNGSAQIDQAIKLSNSSHHNLAGEIGTGGPTIVLDTVNGGMAVREK